MEQFSELEGRIKNALDRISISIEHSKSVQANNNGMDQDLSNKIAELTAANKQLEYQLQQASVNQEARTKIRFYQKKNPLRHQML